MMMMSMRVWIIRCRFVKTWRMCELEVEYMGRNRENLLTWAWICLVWSGGMCIERGFVDELILGQMSNPSLAQKKLFWFFSLWTDRRSNPTCLTWCWSRSRNLRGERKSVLAHSVPSTGSEVRNALLYSMRLSFFSATVLFTKPLVICST